MRTFDVQLTDSSLAVRGEMSARRKRWTDPCPRREHSKKKGSVPLSAPNGRGDINEPSPAPSRCRTGSGRRGTTPLEEGSWAAGAAVLAPGTGPREVAHTGAGTRSLPW
jgi:hypothetical protein